MSFDKRDYKYDDQVDEITNVSTTSSDNVIAPSEEEVLDSITLYQNMMKYVDSNSLMLLDECDFREFDRFLSFR